MIVRLAIFLLAASTVTAAAAPQATKLDTAGRWMARQIVGEGVLTGQFTLPAIEARLMPLFDANANRLPQFRDNAYRLEAQNGISRQRAQYIAKILEKDFDNDGRVTKSELETFYGPQSKMPLRTVEGVQVDPTPQQSSEIVAKLIGRDMQADSNGDGVIDFDEMRNAAEQTGFTPFYSTLSPMRLMDPAILQAFDTSGDHVISRDEFSAAIRKIFAEIDTDNNGLLSPDEIAPFRQFPPFQMKNTF